MNKVIIWGYPLHSHTHSYIHYGYFKAFQSMGFDVHWVDEQNYKHVDFENAIIISEHFVTSYLPRVKSSIYFIHYLGNRGDNHLQYVGGVKKLIDLRYNANCWVDKNYDYHLDRAAPHLQHISKGTIFEKGDTYDIMYTAWATDLLPLEIELEDRFLERENKVYYIGTIGGGRGGLFDCQKAPEQYDTVPYIMPFYEACKKNNIEFISNCPWISPMSNHQAMELIKKSYLAPDFRHRAMLEWGYIPCRVMKNISYGQLGVTNSKAVYDFFDGLVIYNSDSEQLFYDAQAKMKDYDLIEQQMKLIMEHHTYVNRANDIIEIANKYL